MGWNAQKSSATTSTKPLVSDVGLLAWVVFSEVLYGNTEFTLELCLEGLDVGKSYSSNQLSKWGHIGPALADLRRI